MRELLPESNARLFDDGCALLLAVDGATRLVVDEDEDWPLLDDLERSSNSELLNLEAGVEPEREAEFVVVVDAGGRGGGVSSLGVF